MTNNQRKLYLVLHSVQQIAENLFDVEGLQAKSRASLKRITKRLRSEMDALGARTEADDRFFDRVKDKVAAAWGGLGEENIRAEAWVTIGLALLADHRIGLPKGAVAVAKVLADLEGMLFTLYKHLDPEFENFCAMDEGIKVAREFQNIADAA